MKNYGRRFVNTVQEVVTKIISKKKQCKEAKWLLRRAYKQLGREAKGKGGKIYPSECRVPKNSKER